MTKDSKIKSIARLIHESRGTDFGPENLNDFFKVLEAAIESKSAEDAAERRNLTTFLKTIEDGNSRASDSSTSANFNELDSLFQERTVANPKNESANSEEIALESKILSHYVLRMQEKSYMTEMGLNVLKRNMSDFVWASNFDIAPNEAHIPHVLLLLSEIEALLDFNPGEFISSLYIRTRRQWSFDYKLYGFVLDVSLTEKEDSNINPDIWKLLKQNEYDSYISSVITSTPAQDNDLSFSAIMEKADSNDERTTVEPPNNGTFIKVISDDASSVLEKLIGLNTARETSMRLINIQRKLNKEKNFKPLAEVNDNTLDGLGEDNFPNFAELLKFLQSRIALAKMSDGALRLPPILLLGNHGVGKSEFLMQLAKRVKTGFLLINVASAQSASQITGSDIQFYNAKNGDLFDMLAFGKTANPIVFLDELDKPNDRSINPTSALFSLLEKTSAAAFQDLSLPGVTLDASHVQWIAAANSEDDIDPIILSRFKVFKIPDPTKEQMPAIVRSVWKGILLREPAGIHFDALSDKVVQKFSAVSARSARKILEDAMGYAAVDGRYAIEERDIVIPSTKAPTGFLQ
jgi:SpoVK/Ycf46/Vps4 family AAA+-type ATPase